MKETCNIIRKVFHLVFQFMGGESLVAEDY